MDSPTLASWVAAIATLFAGTVALFKESLQSVFFSPKFKVEVRTRSPFCVKNQSTVYSTAPDGKVTVLWTGSFYYARLWVQNVGRRRAEAVELFATKVERIARDGSREPVESFVPSNLRWANTDPVSPEISWPMNPEMGRYCDLGSMANPSCVTLQDIPGAPKGVTTLDLSLQPVPPSNSHRLPPGEYILTFKISAANARPIERQVCLSFSGKWTEDESTMLSRELGVTLL